MCLHVPLLACNLPDVTEQRRTSTSPGGILAAAIEDAGTDVTSVAAATGVPSDSLNDFLSGKADLTVVDLVKVGGFLHLAPKELMGAAA